MTAWWSGTDLLQQRRRPLRREGVGVAGRAHIELPDLDGVGHPVGDAQQVEVQHAAHQRRSPASTARSPLQLPRNTRRDLASSMDAA